MDREQLLERYALALSLVADPDVAGDLFMDARDEADLVRRAARWREARGQGRREPPAVLLPLTEDQAEHALHLARRGELRRRSRRTIGAAGALLTVLAAGILLVRLPAFATRTRPAAAARQAERAPVATASGGLHLTAYKVETTPGTVAVTWGARWAGPEPPAWRPALVVGTLEPQRVRPLYTNVLSTVGGEVKARSTFRAVAQPGSILWLVVETADDRDIVLSGLSVTAGAPPEQGQTLAVGRSLPVGPERAALVETVTLTPDYTEVRYTMPDALAGAGWPHAEVELTLEADGETLRSYGMRDLSRNGSPEPERTEYFPPLPAVSAFRLVSRVHPLDGTRFVYRFDDPQAVVAWQRTATGLAAMVVPERTMAPAGAFVTDAGGREYTADLDCVSVVDGQVRRSIAVTGFPPEAEPFTVTLLQSAGDEPLPGGAIEVPVPDGSSR